MTIASFRKQLESQITSLLSGWVGPTSANAQKVVTFDDHLHDVGLDELPFIVVNVRSREKAGESEIGTSYDIAMWTVHVYYLDTSITWSDGDDRRDFIIGIIDKKFQENRRLGNFEWQDTDGKFEYVYDSEVTSALFDSSGQEGEYSFVTELYLDVYTAKK